MSASDWLTDFKSGTAPKPRNLPQGWEQGFDNKSGRIYYFNRQTQQSSWDVPSGDLVAPTSQPVQRGQQSGGQQVQRDMPMQRNMQMQRGDMTMQRGGGQGDAMQQYDRGNQQQGVSDRGNRGNQQHDVQPSWGGRDGGLDASMAGRNTRGGAQEDDNAPGDWHGGGASSDYQGRSKGKGKDDRGGYKGKDDREGGGYKGGSRDNDDEDQARSWSNYRGKGGGMEGKGGGREEWGKGGRSHDAPIGAARWDTRSDPRSRQPRDEWNEKGGGGGQWKEESTGIVSIARQGYDDNNLPQNDRNFTRRVANAEELNLAENYITGSGLTWMLRPCSNFPHLRVVKMHKNNIGDSAAGSIVKLCKNSPVLNEMHLSHNHITWVGADKIVPAACERQILKNIENGEPTLWLRLEQNQVEDAKDLFSDWQQRGLMVSMYHKSDSHTPTGVILPYFMSQRVPGAERDPRDRPRYAQNQERGWAEAAWPVERWPRAAAAQWWDDGWTGKKGGSKGGWDEQAWDWDWQQSQSSKGKGKGKGKAGQQALGDWGEWSGSKKGKDSEKGGKGKGKGDEGEGKKGKKGEGKGKKAGKGASGNKGLADDGLEEYCKNGATELADSKQIDIANGKLTGVGFSFFSDLCIELATLQIVKLHKNVLNDDAAPGLAAICLKCPALSELHLSHNLITRTGAEEIVAAACEAREGEEGGGLPALWLRLEYNEITEPQTLVDDWKERDLKVTTYSKAPSRHNLPKGVHLPYFLSQGKPSGYVHGEEKERPSKAEWATEEWQEPAREKGAGKGEKKMKWKVKEVKTEEGEEKDEAEKEAKEDAAEDKAEEKAEEKDKAAAGDKKDGDEAQDKPAAKEAKKKRRERQAAEDDDGKERTAFSSGEESDGSDAA